MRESDLYAVHAKWPTGPFALGAAAGLYAFAYSQGNLTQLPVGDPVTPTAAFATAVNDAGFVAALRIVGYGILCPTGGDTLVVENSGMATNPLGTGTNSLYVLVPAAINPNGDVAGTARTNAAAFLCSDLAAGITGEILYVDGGFNTVGMSFPQETEG